MGCGNSVSNKTKPSEKNYFRKYTGDLPSIDRRLAEKADKHSVKRKHNHSNKSISYKSLMENAHTAGGLIKTSTYSCVNIYYGSQTGTAQGFAELLAKDGIAFGVDCHAIDQLNFKPEEFATEKLAIFVIATHYDGDPPDSSEDFHRLIVQKEYEQSFPDLKYCIYGLGDETYRHFNKFAQEVDEELQFRQATRILETKLGSNHDNMIEDDFNEWKENIWSKIQPYLHKSYESNKTSSKSIVSHKLPQNDKSQFHNINQVEVDEIPDIRYLIDFVDVVPLPNSYKNLNPENYDLNVKKLQKSFKARVVNAYDLRQKNSPTGRTIHVEFEQPDEISYKTANNLTQFAENSEDNVKIALNLLKHDCDSGDVFQITNNLKVVNQETLLPFPTPITIHHFLHKFINLQGIVTKTTLKHVATWLKSGKAKNIVKNLLENKEKLDQFHKDKKDQIDLLVDLDELITFNELVDISWRNPARYYTICSSNQKSPKTVSICASIHVDQAENNKKLKQGFCSQYLIKILEDFTNGKEIWVDLNFENSGFKIPGEQTEAGADIICIATGAGIAPFIGMIQEKEHQLETTGKSVFGNIDLFFGCRRKDEDYLYQQNIQKWTQQGIIRKVYEAYSREDNVKKTYVQDQVKENKELFKAYLLAGKGLIYICGNQPMSKSVIGIFEMVIKESEGCGDKEAGLKFDELVKNGRVCIEAW